MKTYILMAAGLVFGLIILAVSARPDDNLHLIACSVGQGDMTLIVYGSREILIDGGPEGGKALGCLGRHLPFWDKEIEAVILTHPQLDHMGGLIRVLANYKVGTFLQNQLPEESGEARLLSAALEENKITAGTATKGTSVKAGLMRLDIVYPREDDLAGTISDANDVSVVARLTFGRFDAVLTGDASPKALEKELARGNVKPAEYIKVPHHGSKNGLTREFLDAVSPALAVISVGKNSYGHPSPEVMEMLEKAKVKTLRTDTAGDVEIVTDGTKWWVK